MSRPPLRVANCSGFYGDRFSAAREMVEEGPIDLLTGDYLAELTMLILWKARQRDSSLGYAATFYRQMEEVLGTCIERGIKIVSNAGGLNPAALADRIRDLAAKLGVHAKVAHVEGDDVLETMLAMQRDGAEFTHLDTGLPLSSARNDPVSANAYLGGFAIAAALEGGADVVVTGRVTDASLVVGPAAWHFGWQQDDLDRLAGAVVAGHIIECGAQATGGNYSFFGEVPGLEHPGFPIAEIAEDGSAVITKHPGTGGLVSVGTVTAQLLYEIADPLYENPDVTADFSTIHLEQLSADRVAVSGTVGVPPPKDLKVAVNLIGGWRNQMTFVLTGLDIEEKADLVVRTLARIVGGDRGFEALEEHDVRLMRTDRADAATNEQASAQLRITVKDSDAQKVGRSFSAAAIELALTNYPGFYLTSPPGEASAYGVYWPTLLPREKVRELVVHDDGRRSPVVAGSAASGASGAETRSQPEPQAASGQQLGSTSSPGALDRTGRSTARSTDDTVRLPLGTLIGARSGDKGGNANVGLWARSDGAFEWLRSELSVPLFRRLLPEAADLEIDRYELPNLRAINFVVRGLLGEGVASSTRTDPQAKSLGEYLRSRLVDVPASLLEAPHLDTTPNSASGSGSATMGGEPEGDRS